MTEKKSYYDDETYEMDESAKCFWVVIIAGLFIFVVWYLGEKFGF